MSNQSSSNNVRTYLRKGHLMLSDASVVNCAPCWMVALMPECVPDVWGQSWIRATGKPAGRLQLAVHQGEKHSANMRSVPEGLSRHFCSGL